MKLILVFIAFVLLSACSKFTLHDANVLRIGISPQEVLGRISKGPDTEFDIAVESAPGKTFHVMKFNMTIGGTDADYYAVFENDKLFYWGHPYEFNRYPDPLYNELGKMAVEKAKTM